MTSLLALHSYVPRLLAPTSAILPFGLIDLYGAARLSSIINCIASGALATPVVETDEKGRVAKPAGQPARASLLQELFGLMLVVFGGETFLCMCTGATPSWLVDPKVAILFCGIHTLQTRTPFSRLLPKSPSFGLELLLSLPDAIGRALLLTKFSVVPLLHPNPHSLTLPATPSTLLLVPVIVAVPFAAIAFTGLNVFEAAPRLSTPAELQPWGWTAVDAWIAVVVPALFLSLIGPVQGWPVGLNWTEQEALVASIAFTWAAFAGRVVYNMGHKREQWLGLFGLGMQAKIKTA